MSIPTIEGRKSSLKLLQELKAETVFKLRGQGMNSVRHSARGNLYVTVTVVVPKKLNSKQKELL
ncbi:MAG: hypothetical protein E7Z74_04415 [Methanobrevibacter millerae]|uniref:Chaperone DnaJ C-terminal domain-containing protein n=1 Tax=Methanobrevibacter millerae TaxID=230361 RepID=A0A8T3VRC4_9EURY|nr:hypothetical protein [Methanobrevibacter millerae]